MFEYVPKSEYQPFKLEVDEILKSIQRDLRENGILTFQFNLIGSAKRKLITRVENGNQGFDLDYNIVIQRIFNNRYKNAKLLKQKFIDLFNKYLNEGYTFGEIISSIHYIVPRVVNRKFKDEDGKAGSKMILVEPRAYSESQTIAEHLKKRNSVVVNLKRVTSDQAKRIIDFLSGCIYAIGGTMQKVGVGIYLCAPKNVNVQGKITEDSSSLDEEENEEVKW